MWLYAWLLRKHSNGERLPDVRDLGKSWLDLHGVCVLEVAAKARPNHAQQVLVGCTLNLSLTQEPIFTDSRLGLNIKPSIFCPAQ